MQIFDLKTMPAYPYDYLLHIFEIINPSPGVEIIITFKWFYDMTYKLFVL